MEDDVPLPEEEGEEKVHPAGDLPEGLQDMGDQMEERPEEEIPPKPSPPQVPPKLLPQLSTGDGECSMVKELTFLSENFKSLAGCITSVSAQLQVGNNADV